VGENDYRTRKSENAVIAVVVVVIQKEEEEEKIEDVAQI